jgi:hypothetical protein
MLTNKSLIGFVASGAAAIAAIIFAGCATPVHAAPCLGPSSNPNGNGLEVYDCGSNSGSALAPTHFAAIFIDGTNMAFGTSWGMHRTLRPIRPRSVNARAVDAIANGRYGAKTGVWLWR